MSHRSRSSEGEFALRIGGEEVEGKIGATVDGEQFLVGTQVAVMEDDARMLSGLIMEPGKSGGAARMDGVFVEVDVSAPPACRGG